MSSADWDESVCEEQYFLERIEDIRACCRWRWTALDMDDRVAEASYVLLTVLRRPNLPQQQVWTVFQRELPAHMRAVNAAEGRHRRCVSLNAQVRRHDGETGSMLMELLPAKPRDHGLERVERFILQLNDEEQMVCAELLLDPSRRRASQVLNMPPEEVDRHHAAIVRQYHAFRQAEA